MKSPVVERLEKELTPGVKAYVDAYAEQLVENGRLRKVIEEYRMNDLASSDYIGSLMNELDKLGFKGFPDYPTFVEQRKNKKPLIYLAIPYTWNPDRSFEIVNKVAAKLMSEGLIVFSPISHSHCIADHLPKDLRTDQEFWMHQDLPMVRVANEIMVVVINNDKDMVLNSKGVQREIAEAFNHNKPVTFHYHYE